MAVNHDPTIRGLTTEPRGFTGFKIKGLTKHLLIVSGNAIVTILKRSLLVNIVNIRMVTVFIVTDQDIWQISSVTILN